MPAASGSKAAMERQNSEFRILFFTQDDPFYVKNFFDEFFLHYPRMDNVGGVVICDVMGKRSFRDLLEQMYGFYGPRDFVRMGFRYLGGRAASASKAVTGRGRPSSLRQLCADRGVPVYPGKGINSSEFVEEVKRIGPDIIVSVAAPVIFKRDLIGAARKGCINIHHGKLPRYRGMMPNFWQLYHGEERVGITVHEINEEIDDGRIILQKEVDVLPDETLASLMARTKRIGAHLVIESIGMMRDGNVPYRDNLSDEGSYFTFPTPGDVQEFKRRGGRIM
ncbi:methionyl-tRNA formyltransferase [Candidatus Moduliflexota bacterium]